MCVSLFTGSNTYRDTKHKSSLGAGDSLNLS